MANIELLKVPAAGAVRGANRAAGGKVGTASLVAATDRDSWAGVKTLLEVGFAVVRVVEIALLFA